MKLTLKELAELVGGSLKGDAAAVVTGAAPLAEAGASDVTFLDDAKRAAELANTKAAVVIVPKGLTADGKALIEAPGHPKVAFAKVLAVLENERRPLPKGIHPSAVVHPTARLAAGVAVGPLAVVEAGAVVGERTVLYGQAYVGENAVIGKDCILYPQTVVRERCVLGDRVILQPGSMIGGDGYGFVQEKGVHHKVPQVGIAVLEDDVEIGANSCVDRAVLGETRVGAGTKVDNLCQIAHNVKTGKGCLIAGLSGVAGSSTLGDYVVLAGDVSVGDHINVGSRTICLARTGVTKDVGEDQIVNGTPPVPVREHWKTQALIRRLPDLFDEVKKLRGQKAEDRSQNG